MKKMIGIVILVSILWIVVGHSYEGNDTSAGTTAEVGSKAPSFTLTSLSGKTYSLSEAKGKPVVLNFWNSWCGPCKKETPELARLYRKYKGQFQLYGINVTADDSLGAVKLFVEDYGVNYPVLLDKSGNVSDLYNVYSRPVTYFINAKGIIVGKIKGYQGAEILNKKVKALVSQ
ncbi:MAG TPA: TlpA disulfide reductase family protein [Bacillales bacterium]